MSSEGSVSHWLSQLKAGDRAAVQHLWERYFQRLVRLACAKLQGTPRRAADEEDAALSAFESFWRGTEANRFPQLFDRNDLWQVLVVITTRKAIDLANHERRVKRGGDAVFGEAAGVGSAHSSGAQPSLEQIIGREPTPAFAAQVAEECQRLLANLGDDQLRSIALWKMEGYTDDEVAAKLDCVPRTVRRKVQRIRSLWAKEMGP